MPLVIVADPQLASYLGIEVGGLAFDERENGGGIVGFQDPSLAQVPTAYSETLLTSIINGLPALPNLRSKLDALLALMHAHGAHGRWADDPFSHARFGTIWSLYQQSETDGDAAALAWPATSGTGLDEFTRITEAGVVRVTEADEIRVTEAAS